MENSDSVYYLIDKMKKITIFLFLLSLFGCSKTIEKPEKFLEKDEMTNLMFELSLLTASRSNYSQDSIFKSVLPQNVLGKYNLDSLSFVELNNYYIQHPEIYAEIYDSINNRLQDRIKYFEGLPEDPRDTITNNQIIKISKFKSILK